MADIKDKQEQVKNPDKIAPGQEVEFGVEELKVPEKKDFSKEEKILSEELKREIELMNLDDNLKKQAEQKANKISFLADDDKLKKLLGIAKEKGVIFAIQVARKMNDPFILDTLHDALAREGYYKDFIK
jgi:hypothetical protein